MAVLLIVHHTPSPHCQEMFEAVVAGATDPEIGGKPYGRDDVRRGGYLQPGDVVRVEIDGIGTLSNPIVAGNAG